MKLGMMRLLPILLSLLMSVGSSAMSEDMEDPEEEAVPLQIESSLSTFNDSAVVQVYNHETGKIMSLEMNEYLQGVVAAEMSLSYGIEALKAQAVAARTLVYYQQAAGYRHAGGTFVCTDYRCCQAWKEPSGSEENLKKLARAVQETQGVIVTYEGEPIRAMYFSSSGGYTEAYNEVWDGEECAYLQSVSSVNEYAFGDTELLHVREFSAWTMLCKLRDSGIQISCDSSHLFESISDIERTDSGRVRTMKVDGVTVSGTKIRNALGLRSTNFYFTTLSNGRIAVVTIGYGHGVGMSQSGAGAMAAEGYSFTEILKHYYTGVTVAWQDLC